MIGSSPESSSRKPDILTIDSGDAINSINLDSYSFSGSCLENGENNIDFSVASSSSGSHTLSFRCTVIKEVLHRGF